MSNPACKFGMATLICLGLAGPAFGHADLKSATPAEGSTVAMPPTEVDLKFSEDLNLRFSGVTITGPNKTTVPVGEAMLMDGNTTLMVPISGPLGAGTYTVVWHVLSADGHKTHGSYTFTLKP